ncbi:MAG: SDR family NAD(P)-dependent oxidoreductase [Planctomycetota bacterium]
MKKTILITGSTDGIGKEAAAHLASLGHRVWLHGRNASKLDGVLGELRGRFPDAEIDAVAGDLSTIASVEALGQEIEERVESLDVLINNAGVFTTRDPRTSDGLDIRFAVNTIAPYALAKRLMPRMGASGRTVNLSSAAQSPVDLRALAGEGQLSDGQAYAQSKLAITMWTRALAKPQESGGPIIVAVNPGSMLGTKMVKDAYGVAGADVRIGAEILGRAALDDDFGAASGQYFDNDSGRFASPHPAALDAAKCDDVVRAIEAVLEKRGV